MTRTLIISGILFVDAVFFALLVYQSIGSNLGSGTILGIDILFVGNLFAWIFYPRSK